MNTYPVHYHLDPPATSTRLLLAIRLVAFAALGLLGLSFGVVFLFAFVALPAFAAYRLSRAPEKYAQEDGPRVLRGLRWFAAISAWMGLTTERLPDQIDAVRLTVDGQPHLQPKAVLWRVITGIPSALVLGVLGFVGLFVWVWAAVSILVRERVGGGAFAYLEGLQRWTMRLLVFQAGLVEPYPPFSFGDAAELGQPHPV